jgi:hypothetical protein
MATHASTSATDSPPVVVQRGPLGNISVQLAIAIALLTTSLLGTLVAYVISLLLA